MHGDLTAECAAAVAAVLDALSAPAGKEDDRTKGQRYHDALAEAMRLVHRGEPAAGAGRAAGQGRVHHPGRPAPAAGQLGPAGGMDGADPGRLGRPPRGRWRPARTTAPGWTGTPPRPSPATPPWPPSSPATSTSTPWRTWSRLCAPSLDKLRQGGDGLDTPASAPPRRGPPSSRPSWGRPWTSCRARAGWPRSCGGGSSGCAWRAEPAAGHRVRRVDPGGDPQRGAAAGPALPVGGRLHPARRRLQVHHTKHKARGGTTSVKDCVLLARSTTRS